MVRGEGVAILRSPSLFLDKYTHETGGVVVPGGLGITVGLKYRVGLHNLILKGALFV